MAAPAWEAAAVAATDPRASAATMRMPKLILLAAGSVLAAAPARAENTISYQTFRYVESDQRIKVLSGELGVEHDFGTDYTAHADIGFDGISGATPCWVAASGQANQYVSGKCKVSSETRNAASGSLAWRDEKRNEYTFGAAVSHEPDFISNEVSAQAKLWRDDAHNQSWTAGIGVQDNTAKATGFTNNASDGKIHALNAQAGVNQVIDRSSTVEGSVFASRESGFLSHQYLKIVRTDAIGQNTLADDSRPSGRNAGGASVRWIKSWRDDLVTNLWYRFYRDSWGISSNTVEARASWSATEHWRVNPLLRLFQQGGADFYRAYGATPNTFAPAGYGSNDARLGTIHAATTQLDLEYRADKDWSFNAGFSHYAQNTGLHANWVTAGFVMHY